MDNEDLIAKIKTEFKTGIGQVTIRKKTRVQVEVKPEKLPELANWLFREEGLRFIIASASDVRDRFEIVYHFSQDETGLVLDLQVFLPRENPQIKSLAPQIDAANWIEREIHELFGIRFLNHPHLEPLFSDGNWEPGTFPYVKTPLNSTDS